MNTSGGRGKKKYGPCLVSGEGHRTEEDRLGRIPRTAKSSEKR